MENILNTLSQASGLYMVLIGVAVLVLWFLPAFLALFFNPKHFKLILLACIPAGLSIIAWSGVLIWATTGKMTDKYRRKPATQRAS